MHFIGLLLISMVVTLLAGCATTKDFNSIPLSESDFKKPLSDIKEQYSDVELYESYWRGIPTKVGSYNNLEEKWGKADRVETMWGEKVASSLFGAALVVYGTLPVAAYLAIETIFIYPTETHYWSKGDTQVKVVITRVGTEGYERKVGHWEWDKHDVNSQPGEIPLVVGGGK